MTEEQRVTELTLEEFESLTRVPVRKHWQYERILAMEPGTALQMDHAGVQCNARKRGACPATQMRSRVAKLFPERMYSMTHARNGDILIACYPRDLNGRTERIE